MSSRVVLGLGSNVGARLENLIAAVRALSREDGGILRNVRVSDIYESEALLLPDSPPEWNLPFYNLALSGDAALTPRELLDFVKSLERKLGRIARGVWAPREIDIDILAYGNALIEESDLRIPHPGLLERPFALWPLAAVEPVWRDPRAGEYHLASVQALSFHWGFLRENVPCRTWRARIGDQLKFSIALEDLPVRFHQGILPSTELVGILNVTPDSFSDGGELESAQLIAARAREQFNAGASILDIGGESTRPGGVAVEPSEEWTRVELALQAIKTEFRKDSLKPLVSVDTRHPYVAERAMAFGIDWLNDVEGFANPEMVALAASGAQDLVVMHSLSVPVKRGESLPNDCDVVSHIRDWAIERTEHLERLDIDPARIVLDPGIGFGKTSAQTLELIARAEELQSLNLRLLFGHSRKSFLAPFTKSEASERDAETSVMSSLLASKSVDYLRVHDVRMNQAALTLSSAASVFE